MLTARLQPPALAYELTSARSSSSATRGRPTSGSGRGCTTHCAVGLLGANDLQNLSAALLVAEETPDTQLVVRMFSAELAGGDLNAVLGDRARR